MKVVIAPDSFKGSLSALQVANAINKGVKEAFPHADTVLIPVADGGEGTMETLVTATNGVMKKVKVTGPLGDEVEASYGVLGDQETCVIEMASASGINLVPKNRLSPLDTTTYGTGELIKAALDEGYRKFIIALGGSATNDGGCGMLQALGMKILDETGNNIGFGGKELNKVYTIDLKYFDKRIQDSTFLIASDVENPLIGPNGASYIFGPQKGASEEDVKILDENLTHWANKVEELTGIHLHDMPGAGAAGGIGGAFLAFFPNQIKRGIDIVLEYTKFHEKLSNCDLVITGEGKVDFQTSSGKTPLGVAQAAQKHNVPTIIIAGSIGEGVDVLYEHGILSIHSIIHRPMTLNEAMDESESLLEFCAEQVVRTYFSK